eukprot:8376537-Alexandrium_andersonii.AAC.1
MARWNPPSPLNLPPTWWRGLGVIGLLLVTGTQMSMMRTPKPPSRPSACDWRRPAAWLMVPMALT